VLRGFALIGIIVANMRGFNSAMEVYMQPYLVWDGTVGRITQGLIDCFVSGKFMTLFAMLFGLGFAVQLERGGGLFRSIYLRRMAGLVAFGAIHAFLIWWGDILLIYAAMGLLLLLFRRSSNEALILWSMVLYFFPVLPVAASIFVLPGGAAAPETLELTGEAIRRATEIYSRGSFVEILSLRWQDWVEFNSSAPILLPRILAMFLFGMWVWRQGFFQRIEEYLPLIRTVWKWSFWVGITGNAAYAVADGILQPDPAQPGGWNSVLWIVGVVAVPALSLFYACSIVLLFRSPVWRRLLLPFAAVGRLALTNYLMQGLISTTIFYSYGLGLFGTVGPLAGLGLALAIYAAQVLFSIAWARAFRFGPLEWVWRSVTYGRWQPMV